MSNGYAQPGIRIRWLPIVLALVVALFVMARGCQEGPFGRHQIVGLDVEQEAQLGEQTYQKILQQEQVVREGKAVDAVQRVGRRLAGAAASEEFLNAVQLHPQKFVWEFQLVRSDQVNAFCLPGGKVVVYTGLLPVAKNEAGLATVLGHEIGHALAHHGAERIAQQELVQIGEVAASQSIDNLSLGQRQQLMALLGAGSQVGVLLPFSRKHESEADHIG
jgi:predicted Zn-dependent protease